MKNIVIDDRYQYIGSGANKKRGCVVIKVYGAASYFLATEGGIFLRRLISEVFPKIFDSQAVKSAI